jgi:Rps23 Pro-64 3,4-dihydroxylase Tpa1-like proline 4-hydroxylase
VSGVTATEFYFERERLVGLARERAEAYRSAWPFPHAVIDDLIPAEVARACHEEFAQASREHWQLYTDAGNTRKLELSDETRMGPVSRHLVAQFNGRVMIEFLEELTGIRGLVGDPHLVGGGLHELGPGGFLRVHADFNIHPLLALDRRLNLLLYLNEDWDESWGGELELWDAEMAGRADPVIPVLGRAVIFNVTDTSFHGNPNVVSCPPDRARRSLAFYYYSNGRPDAERSEAHSTLYQTPGVAPTRPSAGNGSRARRLAKELAPPLLVRAARRARRR